MSLAHKKVIIDRINLLVFVVYALLIFEGALRKWVLPQLSSPLFFIKDPFMIYIYWLCFYHKLFPKNFYFTITMLLALLFYFMMSLQAMLIPFNVIAGIYGWRTYFFYLPLAFVIGEYYDKTQLIRIAKFTCLVGIPIAALTYLQYKSPVDSYINRNVGMGESQAYTVLENIVRPSGTFSFTTGQSAFISTLLIMLLYNFFLPKNEKFLKAYLFYIAFFAFFVNLAVSGSRGAYVNVGIILSFLLLAALILFRLRQGFNILVYLIIGVLISYLTFELVFYNELQIMAKRQEIAASEEGSLTSRMLSIAANLDFLTDGVTFLGYGLGLSSGGGSFLVTGARSFVLSEGDWGRNVLEAGIILGTAYVLFRIFLSTHIINTAINSVVRSKNPMPMVFLGYVIPSLLIGSITGNGTANVYNWLFVGFSLAINRVYSEKNSTDASIHI